MHPERLLITGGTGTFGKAFARRALRERDLSALCIYSRDELKQAEMRADPAFQDPRMRWFIGDVRDSDRLEHACSEVDTIIHAAALKRIEVGEYNPTEVVKTNVGGAVNVASAARKCHVGRVVALSSDKAVNPINTYGASKLLADKIMVAANATGEEPFMNVVRYGNVIGSRGSVVALFQKMKRRGLLTLTDPDATRFLITVDEAIDVVMLALQSKRGGDIYVPKMPTATIGDIAEAVAPGVRHETVGLRAGEKKHEVMLSADEWRYVIDIAAGCYVLQPTLRFTTLGKQLRGEPVPERFLYSSESTEWRLTPAQIKAKIYA